MMEHAAIIPQHDDLLVADLALGGPQAVLVLSGWGGTRYGPQRILVETARAFAERGFTTLRLDFRGRGDSTGDPADISLDGMIEDVLTAINWLRSEHGVERIHLVGLCSGGNVALGAASLAPELVDNVVCWSLLPFMEHKAKAAHQGANRKLLLAQMFRKALRPETWRKLLRGEANVQGAMKVIAKDKEGDELERQRKTSRRDILGDLATYRGHLRLIYGSHDPEAAGSEVFFTDWCKRNCIPIDVRVIAGAPHNFYTAQWTARVIEQTVAWVAADRSDIATTPR